MRIYTQRTLATSVLINSELGKMIAERDFCLFSENLAPETMISENATAAISGLTEMWPHRTGIPYAATHLVKNIPKSTHRHSTWADQSMEFHLHGNIDILTDDKLRLTQVDILQDV